MDQSWPLLTTEDGTCRVNIVYRDTPRLDVRGTVVMVQSRPSLELAIAAIARDFTTFATRALASLPTIGELVESYEDEDEDCALTETP